jgi:hypothetical protein
MMKLLIKISDFLKTTLGIATAIISIVALLGTAVTVISKYAVIRYLQSQGKSKTEISISRLVTSDSIKSVQQYEIIIALDRLQDSTNKSLIIARTTNKYMLRHLAEENRQDEIISMLKELLKPPPGDKEPALPVLEKPESKISVVRIKKEKK